MWSVTICMAGSDNFKASRFCLQLSELTYCPGLVWSLREQNVYKAM